MGQPIEPQITWNMLINWAVMVGIGIMVLGLVKYIFKNEVERVRDLKQKVEEIPDPEMILTDQKHYVVCKSTLEEVKILIKENRDVVLGQYKDLKDYMILKVESEINKILVELKRVNGK